LVALVLSLHWHYGRITQKTYDQIRTGGSMTLADAEQLVGHRATEVKDAVAAEVLTRMIEVKQSPTLFLIAVKEAEKRGLSVTQAHAAYQAAIRKGKRVMGWGSERCFIRIVIDENGAVLWKEKGGL
jgi:hypothetical protein